MEFKKITQLLLPLVVCLSTACERSLYFAAPEINMLSRLEKVGDVQLQGAVVNAEGQQSYQAMGEVAFTNRLALRAGWLKGGDDFEPVDKQFGRINAYQLGLGTFYPIGNTGLMATSWLGYSRGEVRNVSLLINMSTASNPEYFRLNNSYSRLYFEQQARLTFRGVDFFGMLRAGRTQVFDFSQQAVPGDPTRLGMQLNQQLRQPNLYFATLGYGMAGGSKNLRIHFQFEHWVGQGRQQISDDLVLSISTGLSWRFGTAEWFR